jgi:hypothetical protein
LASILRRLPPLATTGIGSLPHDNPTEAAHHAASAYELPFCPQLPRLHGDMVREWLGADPSRCGWAPDRDRQMPAAWEVFALQLERRPPPHRIVKLQVTGPVTLAIALDRPPAGRPPLALAREAAAWLGATAAARVAELRALGLDTLLIVDEPGLAAADMSARDVRVWDPLRAAAPAWGLHVCCAVPWALVDAAEPDALSFDLTGHGLPPAARGPLTRLIARSGRIMWGALDPLVPGDPAAARARIGEAQRAIGADRHDGLVSPACGSGLLTVGQELALAELVAAVAGRPVPPWLPHPVARVV